MTAEERENGLPGSKELIMLAANGNNQALEYLLEMDAVERVLDDLIDKDFEVSNHNLLRVFRWMMIECYANVFYMKNLYTLATCHALVMSAWEQSNDMEHGTDTEKVYFHVLKEGFIQIISAVALLTGGYSHMREVEKKAWQILMKPLGVK